MPNKLDKMEVFTSYYDCFSGSDLFDLSSLRLRYLNAIVRYTLYYNEHSGKYTKEEIDELMNQIIFYAYYRYGEYNSRNDEPIIDVEIEHLPINMKPEQLKQFKKAIQIIVDTYDEIFYHLGYGKHSPLKIEMFDELFNKTKRFSINIPLVFLYT